MKPTKSQIFKKLLKEAVREVIREELKTILIEQRNVQIKDFNDKNAKPLIREVKRPDWSEFLPKSPQRAQQRPAYIPTTVSNPLASLIQDTAKNMSGDEYSTIVNANSSMINSQGSVGMNPQSMMDSIGEIEDWNPTSVHLPNM